MAQFPKLHSCDASKSANTNKVHQLNDDFRRSFIGGQVVITNGTDALSTDDKLAMFELVKTFDDFTPDNDPYGEHDFGSFKFNGESYYWKIDCYDLDHLGHSPDPTDPSVTRRVLTVMMAREY